MKGIKRTLTMYIYNIIHTHIFQSPRQKGEIQGIQYKKKYMINNSTKQAILHNTHTISHITSILILLTRLSNQNSHCFSHRISNQRHTTDTINQIQHLYFHYTIHKLTSVNLTGYNSITFKSSVTYTGTINP